MHPEPGEPSVSLTRSGLNERRNGDLSTQDAYRLETARIVKRPVVNITPIERGGRIVIGLVCVIAALVLLLSANTAWAVVLEVLFLLAGVDLIVTGALGHCPLYRKLGHVPASLRGHA